HLEDLKARGVRFVAVSPESLAGLARGRRMVAVTSRSAPPGAARPLTPTLPPSSYGETVPENKPDGGSEKTSARPSASLTPKAGTVVPAKLGEKAEAKAAAFADLRQRALVCVKCPHLAKSRKNVVFGVGDINAQLMFIGEAPGADEDAQGEPFVGKAGQLLTKIIQTAGL